MNFQFYCPQGHLLQSDTANAGATIACPICGTQFIVPPPPQSVLAARPAWDPPPPAPSAVPAPGDGAPAGRPALPVSSLLADLAPAAPLFSARRPPPPAPPENGPAGPVSVARFRGAPDAPPAAVVDAPGADPARLRKLEADAYSELR